MNPIAQLSRRARQLGASPLFTHIDLSEDSRIELSGTTLANWVDKTTSMIDGLGITAGTPIELQVGRERPDHWVSLVWVLACWQYGSRAELQPSEEQELVVQGPGAPHGVPGLETVACSLHPWGLGFAQPVAGVIDYRDVLAEPDVHWENPPPQTPGMGLAWEGFGGDPETGRLLLHGVDALPQLVASFCRVLVGGGSLIVVRGQGDLARVQRSEGATQILSFGTEAP